ncbi:MAG: hypothetical protein PHY92_03615 [Alphaproteobacteria bacterium]|nr:hypothetical protein [Alphaproteobacteria bacterium]
MIAESAKGCPVRLKADAGIAIGPILFIIAVLGILAAAIAAGSGSFTTSTTGESNRTKAAALIEQGQNLKVGMDRLMSYGDITLANILINEANTQDRYDLFSPTGGGIAAPSITMSATPTADNWYYVWMQYPGIGSTAASYGGATGSKVAMLHVSPGVCDEINSKANAIAPTNVPGASVGAVKADIDITDTGMIDATGTDVWPPLFSGKPTGCVQNSDDTATGDADDYFYYQVIAVQ